MPAPTIHLAAGGALDPDLVEFESAAGPVERSRDRCPSVGLSPNVLVRRPGRFGTRPDLTALEERIGSADGASHPRLVWETVDPDSRTVVLWLERWQHILEEHPELLVTPEIVLSAVAEPDRRRPGHEADEEWFYRSGPGPTRR